MTLVVLGYGRKMDMYYPDMPAVNMKVERSNYIISSKISQVKYVIILSISQVIGQKVKQVVTQKPIKGVGATQTGHTHILMQCQNKSTYNL